MRACNKFDHEYLIKFTRQPQGCRVSVLTGSGLHLKKMWTMVLPFLKLKSELKDFHKVFI